MIVQITTSALALVTLAMLLLAIFWPHIPINVRSHLVQLAVAILVIHLVFTVSKWETASDRMNVSIKWAAIAGYELLLMLFARLSPRWLTGACAFILIVPVFSANTLMPLMPIFDKTTNKLNKIGPALAYQRLPWGGDDSTGNSGVDLMIYYRPAFAPFLRHNIQHFSFNNRQCNANSSFATPGPTPKTILMRCPYWPSQGAGSEDRQGLLH